MGGQHGAATIHTITGLKFGDIATIGKHCARELGMPTPTVDIDSSQVFLQTGSSVTGLIKIMEKYAKAGFRVVPVCDGTQLASKQATPARAARREKN